jgi:hypothetical protein
MQLSAASMRRAGTQGLVAVVPLRQCGVYVARIASLAFVARAFRSLPERVRTALVWGACLSPMHAYVAGRASLAFEARIGEQTAVPRFVPRSFDRVVRSRRWLSTFGRRSAHAGGWTWRHWRARS